MSEHKHIQRLIKQAEVEESAAVNELIVAAQQLVTRVKLDLMPTRHMGWGGGVIERVERAIAAIRKAHHDPQG